MLFSTIFIPSEKLFYAPVSSPFEKLSNENSFKQFVANFLLPNCKAGY